jgi:NADH:ubiquinone oxidoreductase subunit 4 (subunit M)
MTTMPTAADLMPLLPELVLVGGAFALLMLDLFIGIWPKPLTDLMEPSIAHLASQLAASKL